MSQFLEDISEVESSNFHLDSRKVQKDDIFFAYPGETQDGRAFIDQAIKNGARIIFYEDCSPPHPNLPPQRVEGTTLLYKKKK